MSNQSDSRPKPAESKGRGQGSQQTKRAGRAAPGDERRLRRSSGTGPQHQLGFGDGRDHALCVSYRHRLPREFPPQDRSGLAMMKPGEVANRPDAVLLCDRQHPGPCMWPDGEAVPADAPNQGIA